MMRGLLDLIGRRICSVVVMVCYLNFSIFYLSQCPNIQNWCLAVQALEL